MRWGSLDDGKKTVEEYSQISVFELRKNAEWTGRNLSGIHHMPFYLGTTRVILRWDTGGWWLELLDAPRGTDTAINMSWTPCNYGGVRYWFDCQHCGKIVAKLYRTKDYRFQCRGCLNLCYESQKESYRGIMPWFRKFWKLEHTQEPSRPIHNHKLTKKAAKFWKLRDEVAAGFPRFQEYIK